MRRNIGVTRVAASLLSQITEGEPCSNAHQRCPLHDRLACHAAAAAHLCTAKSSYCEHLHAHASKPVGHLTSGKPIMCIKLCGTPFSASAHQLGADTSTQADKAVQLSTGVCKFSIQVLPWGSTWIHQTNETKAEVDGLVTSRLYLQRQLRARRNRRQRASCRRPEAWWSGWAPSLQTSHWRSCPSASLASDFVSTQLPTTATQSPQAQQPLKLPEHCLSSSCGA